MRGLEPGIHQILILPCNHWMQPQLHYISIFESDGEAAVEITSTCKFSCAHCPSLCRKQLQSFSYEHENIAIKSKLLSLNFILF